MGRWVFNSSVIWHLPPCELKLYSHFFRQMVPWMSWGFLRTVLLAFLVRHPPPHIYKNSNGCHLRLSPAVLPLFLPLSVFSTLSLVTCWNLVNRASPYSTMSSPNVARVYICRAPFRYFHDLIHVVLDVSSSISQCIDCISANSMLPCSRGAPTFG